MRDFVGFFGETLLFTRIIKMEKHGFMMVDSNVHTTTVCLLLNATII